MFGNCSFTAKAMPLALLGLLVSAGWSLGQPAGAQGTGWISGGSQLSPSGGSYRGPSYATPSYYSAPPTYYAPPTAAPSAPTTTGYQSFYPPQPDSRNRAVLLNVSVPANAQLWIEGEKMALTGTLRRFVSPPIVAGSDYTYDIKATWTQDGKEMTQNRHFTVHAGDVINLTLNTGNGR